MKTAPILSDEQILKLLNTAVVSSKEKETKNLGRELQELIKSPAFQVILASVRELARRKRIPERDAAEQIVSAFHRLDDLWTTYVQNKGVQDLKFKSQEPRGQPSVPGLRTQHANYVRTMKSQ